MNRPILCAVSLAVLAVAGGSWGQTSGPAAAPESAQLLNAPKYGQWGLDLAGRDTSVRPGDDFNRYSNGKALDAMKIPADRAGWGVDYVLEELSENRTHAILTGLGDRPTGVPADEAKAGAFYKAFMDEARVNALGLKPVEPSLAAIKAAKTRSDLVRLMAQPGGRYGSIFDLDIAADFKDPNRYAVWASQSGLGLPDRDYYLKPAFAEKKAKYEAYVAKILGMAGWPDAAAAAKAVVAYETKIAEAQWTRVEDRDPVATYNPKTIPELQKLAPGFDWPTFLRTAEVGSIRSIVVGEPSAFTRIAAGFTATPMPTLKAWAAFHLVDNAAPYLSEPFVDARFQFRNKELAGVEAQRDRWKRAVALVNGAMGDAVGKAYVARYFPPDAKAKIDALVSNLMTAMAGRIQKVSWMGPATKAEAEKKLAKITRKIAYPDEWRDYSALVVREDDLLGDVRRADAWDWNRKVKRMNGPVDRIEWEFMSPQTVNAYYYDVMNEVVFPAAFLQPPQFDPNADPAVNYGAIGATIGHEITHGFDDKGRKVDGDGKLRDWWTMDDARKFEAASKALGTQYSGYEIAGAHVNGELTMGENIADLGGMLIALDAYHISLHGQPAPVIDGLTGDQRFFLAYAQSERNKRRDEALRQQLVSDPHSPEEFRVNGVVRNMDAWYAAFDVKPGDKLYVAPDRRPRIW